MEKKLQFQEGTAVRVTQKENSPWTLDTEGESKQVVDIKVRTERKKELNVKRLTTATPLPKVPSIKEMSHS